MFKSKKAVNIRWIARIITALAFVLSAVLAIDIFAFKLFFVCLGLCILWLTIISIMVDLPSSSKMRAPGIPLIAFVFSALGLAAGLLTAVLDSESKYTHVIGYKPAEIIRSCNDITLKGTSVALKSLLISDYTKKNPSICKEERYNSFHFRLSDEYSICDAEYTVPK